ncbi:hypothetical protein MSG28_008706 [Choristoneura fumiferana]|uniref:Uncharacterized protein n=1 Tax=Choristoneura fumiferana TaxID=7141 RepID=A0ACC0J7N8_CHOFU|nr:hypothetical protein MSG28_008706 [Choristoneura fumiferana]
MQPTCATWDVIPIPFTLYYVILFFYLQVVGREGVLASTTTREVRCGRRLVSGLFSRPRLPLGYSYVATVPRGACRLNISEIVSSDNYIALKVTNGSYIMNGEFAVSAPGTYEAAGARFMYSRAAGLDAVFAHGPLHHPIDIMILYTQPSPNIKYEYLTDSEDETSNDIPTVNPPPQHHQATRHHRHHSAESHTRALEYPSEPSLSRPMNHNQNTFDNRADANTGGERKFTWKVLSFNQCTRTCGGGLQIGKFRCVEIDGKNDREVSAVHCSGNPPPSRRRRCGMNPCPPRWRAAPWGTCPVCGPAYRTRIVGCVQDHARGITKISDQKCPLPMPPSSELCDIPNCDGTVTTEAPRPDTRRQVRPRDRTDTFRDGPVISLARNVTDNEIGPTLSQQSFSHTGAGGWLYTEWSECVGWCVGGGVQSRGVRCADPSGCAAHRAPTSSQSCALRKQCDAQWFTGDWSSCSASCSGRQVRGVICIGGNGRRLRDGSCRAPKPEAERACGGTCAPSWYLSDWSECQGPCEAGVQTRTVWCARGGVEGAEGAARDAECHSTRPLARRTCARLCHYPYYADYCCHSCHGGR